MRKRLSFLALLLTCASGIMFVQSCQDDVFTLSQTEFSLGAEGGAISVTATSNLAYSVSSMPDWITESAAGTKAATAKTHTFTVAENTATSARTGSIIFCNSKMQCIPVNVTQSGVEATTLSLGQTLLQSVAGGDSQSVAVTTNSSWTASSDQSWCTISPQNGSGNGTFTVTTVANSSSSTRTANVTVTAGIGDNTTTKTLMVTQAGKEDDVFTLSQTEFSLGAEGGAISVTATSNLAYSVSSMPDWITESAAGTKAATAKTHTFTVAENTATSARTGSIIFCNSKMQCIPVNVTQSGVEATTLSLGQTLLQSVAGGDSQSVAVTTNSDWTASSDQSWCTISPRNGSGNGTFTVTTAANSSSSTRTANVTVTAGIGDNTTTKTLMVTQAGMTEDNSWVNKDLYHHSLVMKFTATWCGYCPMMSTAIEDAKARHPDKIEEVNLHVASSALAFSGTSTLASQYSINAYPTASMDGRAVIQNYGTSNPYFEKVLSETEASYPTVTGAAWTSSISGSTISVNLKVYAKKADSYKVTVLVLEDGIVKLQSDYYNGTQANYVHNSVARLALSDISGDQFTTSQDGKTWSHTYSGKLSSSWNSSNLRVLVYIQRSYGSQTKVQGIVDVIYGDYGDYYVDNAMSGKVGDAVELLVMNDDGTYGNNESIIIDDPIGAPRR